MQKVKWLFFVYIAFLALAIVAIAVAFRAAPPRDPDTYYLSYGSAVKTLDPAENDDTMGSQILGYIFEGLYNYKYGVVPYQVFPELASAMPVYSADGLTMTIPIRHGIHYYDPEKAIWSDGVGPEVTAEDFVYSFKRGCDFNLASPNYSFVFQGNFVGLDDWWDYTKSHADQVDFSRPMPGFEAADRYTLILHFTKPYPQMIYNLVNNPCSPICKEIVDHYGKTVRLHPVGTGPYCMIRNLRDQQMVFEANPIYRGRPDVDGDTKVPAEQKLPKTKRIQLDYVEEDIPNWIMLNQGLFDIGGIARDAYHSAISAGGDLTPEMIAKGIQLRKSIDPTIEYIGINCGDSVLGKNRPLRQAISMAFDRNAFVKRFLNGRGTPAIGLLPPGFPTYDEHRVNPYTQFDLPKARELMEQAIEINGGPIPKLGMLFRGTDTIQRQEAEFYVEQFSQIGIRIDPQLVDFARFQELCDNRQTQLFDAGWSSDYPDEQDFLQLFTTDNIPDKGLNATVWSDSKFDQMYNKSKVLPESPARTAMYLEAEKYLEQECPAIFLYCPVTFGLQYDWVHDRKVMDYGHGYTQFISIDKDLRAKRMRGGN
jgi:oligopeptide transport system substrate-binding protein